MFRSYTDDFSILQGLIKTYLEWVVSAFDDSRTTSGTTVNYLTVIGISIVLLGNIPLCSCADILSSRSTELLLEKKNKKNINNYTIRNWIKRIISSHVTIYRSRIAVFSTVGQLKSNTSVRIVVEKNHVSRTDSTTQGNNGKEIDQMLIETTGTSFRRSGRLK